MENRQEELMGNSVRSPALFQDSKYEEERERDKQEPWNDRLRLGVYRHFKGGEYDVLGISRDSETEEEKVVYRARYGARGLWHRSLKMFLEDVEVDGKRVPRFQYIGEEVDE